MGQDADCTPHQNLPPHKYTTQITKPTGERRDKVNSFSLLDK